MKRTTMFLLLAAVPQAAIWAQTGTPAAPNVAASLCGHAMDAATFFDARVRNAAREEAVVMRWLDPKGTAVHSALFMGRCLAKDGDTIDGKVIARVLPNSVAVSERHALTAWEADYWNYPGEQGSPHRGAFNENRFVAELDPSKASEAGSVSGADPDFRWNEEQETLTLKPGVVLVPTPIHYTYQAAPNNGQSPNAQPTPVLAAKPCTPQQGPKVNVHIPKKPSAWACKTLGICPDDKPVVVNGDNGCPAAPASGQPAK